MSAWEWQWVSQPLQSSLVREMRVMEIVVVAQGEGQIEVSIAGDNENENDSYTYTFNDAAKPKRMTATFDVRAEDIVLRIHATGQGAEEDPDTEAPTLHAIHIGSLPGNQVERH